MIDDRAGHPATYHGDTQTPRSTWPLAALAVPDGDRWQVHYHGIAEHRPVTGGAVAARDSILRTDPEVFDEKPSPDLLTDLARRTLGLLEIDCGECDGAGDVWIEDEDDGYREPCYRCNGEGRVLLGTERNDGSVN